MWNKRMKKLRVFKGRIEVRRKPPPKRFDVRSTTLNGFKCRVSITNVCLRLVFMACNLRLSHFLFAGE